MLSWIVLYKKKSNVKLLQSSHSRIVSFPFLGYGAGDRETAIRRIKEATSGYNNEGDEYFEYLVGIPFGYLTGKNIDKMTTEESLVERLKKRAEIRRQISTRKSVQEGSPDRISDLLEEAANEIVRLQKFESNYYGLVRK